MRVHAIRHVPFEDAGTIPEWAAERRHTFTESFASTKEYPDLDDVGLLVVMGGPMGANDEASNPWLRAEKGYISDAIVADVPVLGICLGAQIIADIMGAKVQRNGHKEIGWFPVEMTERGSDYPCFAEWDESAVVGHWHGDAIELPISMCSGAHSDATPVQAFATCGCRVVGLQFHLEWTEESLERLIGVCHEDLVPGGPYVQSASEILEAAGRHLPANRRMLFSLLDYMASKVRSPLKAIW